MNSMVPAGRAFCLSLRLRLLRSAADAATDPARFVTGLLGVGLSALQVPCVPWLSAVLRFDTVGAPPAWGYPPAPEGPGWPGWPE